MLALAPNLALASLFPLTVATTLISHHRCANLALNRTLCATLSPHHLTLSTRDCVGGRWYTCCCRLLIYPFTTLVAPPAPRFPTLSSLPTPPPAPPPARLFPLRIKLNVFVFVLLPKPTFFTIIVIVVLTILIILIILIIVITTIIIFAIAIAIAIATALALALAATDFSVVAYPTAAAGGTLPTLPFPFRRIPRYTDPPTGAESGVPERVN